MEVRPTEFPLNLIGEVTKQYQQITNTGYITNQTLKDCVIPKEYITIQGEKININGPDTKEQGIQQEVYKSGYTKADYQKMIQANDEKIAQLEGKDPKVSATKPVKKELEKDAQKAQKVQASGNDQKAKADGESQRVQSQLVAKPKATSTPVQTEPEQTTPTPATHQHRASLHRATHRLRAKAAILYHKTMDRVQLPTPHRTLQYRAHSLVKQCRILMVRGGK